VNCRQGPSNYLYPFNQIITAQEVIIAGSNSKGTWYAVHPLEDNEICWVLSQYVTLLDKSLDLPILEDPALTEKKLYAPYVANCTWGTDANGWQDNSCRSMPKCYLDFNNYTLESESAAWAVSNKNIIVLYVIPYVKESGVTSFSEACPVTLESGWYKLTP
jgi:hypothetical protein